MEEDTENSCLLAGFEFWKIQKLLKLLSSDVHMVQREVGMHYLSILHRLGLIFG
jgi:hypothetical protein